MSDPTPVASTVPAPVDRPDDPRIPPMGSVSQPERMFRVNWVAAEWKDGDVPLLSADFVSRLGRQALLLDIRAQEDLLGPLGHVPGSTWVPPAEVEAAVEGLHPDTPMVIISNSGLRSHAVVRTLQGRGFRFVGAMQGGMWSWKELGFSVSRDASVLSTRGRLPREPYRWVAAPGHASLDDVQRHVGDPMSIRWLKLAALLVHGRVSCVDGRDGSGVMGTPGGYAGEFALLLAAYERVTGRTLSDGNIRTLMQRRVAEFGRFYAHTDIHASNALITALRADRRFDRALEKVFHALEWRAFYRNPPADVRDALLEHACKAEHLGCGHLKLGMLRAQEYGTRPGLVRAIMASIFQERWLGSVEVEVAVLLGGHAEGGVLSVFMEDGLQAFSRIPLIAPSSGERQFFVAHPQVAGFLRHQQVRFLQQQADVAPMSPGELAQLDVDIHGLAEKQLGVTLGALAAGLPVFQVRFGKNGSLRVVEAGRVG